MLSGRWDDCKFVCGIVVECLIRRRWHPCYSKAKWGSREIFPQIPDGAGAFTALDQGGGQRGGQKREPWTAATNSGSCSRGNHRACPEQSQGEERGSQSPTSQGQGLALEWRAEASRIRLDPGDFQIREEWRLYAGRRGPGGGQTEILPGSSSHLALLN